MALSYSQYDRHLARANHITLEDEPSEPLVDVIVANYEDGRAEEWVRIEEWRRERDLRGRLEDGMVRLGIRVESLRKALWCAATGCAIACLALMWIGVRALIGG